MSLFPFDARFFCLSAAQNAAPTGGKPGGDAFCAGDKKRNCASKVNKHIAYSMHRFKRDARKLNG